MDLQILPPSNEILEAKQTPRIVANFLIYSFCGTAMHFVVSIHSGNQAWTIAE
jgi:hypothetical protein